MKSFSRILMLPVLVTTLATAWASDPIWEAGKVIDQPRPNPLGLSESEFVQARIMGRLYALNYPVEVSGALLPWKPTRRFLDVPSPNPIRFLFQSAFEGFSRIRSSDDLLSKVGLHPYPTEEGTGPYEIPFLNGIRPEVRMGASVFSREGTDVLTISCAACHSSDLFGKKVLGLTNRFPHANEFFVMGIKASKLIGAETFKTALGASKEETRIYSRLRDRARSVGAKMPQTEGLDTSLAQVALSLAHRSADDYASFDPHFQKSPRPEPLFKTVADSKPAVWWNVKYKNRWLSDGSVLSGNPIYTNLLWNEIGRGTDLHELEQWLDAHPEVVRDLTTAVFSAEAPKFTDFFPAERINPAQALHGESLFNQACAKCHGTYVKAWSIPEMSGRPWLEQIQTIEVKYPQKTKVIDVGTDPLRWQGMVSLEKGLNPLAISRRSGVTIQAQKGYVPPPLVGIWARWPYFHNNSAPNLCAVLTPGPQRPSTYWAGEALDPSRDFDSECNGYPLGQRVPPHWKKELSRFFDTSKPGLSRLGHDDRILLKEGREIFTPEDKRDLIQFLQTL